MVECRRRIDLDALAESPAESPADAPADAPCLHFVATWNGGGAGASDMVTSVLLGLEGNRELVIRNLRPRNEDAQALLRLADRRELEATVHHELHVVDERAAFGDQHQRAAASRALAQQIVGADPMLGGGTLRG